MVILQRGRDFTKVQVKSHKRKGQIVQSYMAIRKPRPYSKGVSTSKPSNTIYVFDQFGRFKGRRRLNKSRDTYIVRNKFGEIQGHHS